MIADDIRARRERVVLDHFADEVAQDWDATLSTFPHPRYEIVPLGVVHDGEAEVRAYYHDTRVAFPDQHHEMIALRHADDAVIVEFFLLGTHLGPLGPVPPTGSSFRVRMTAYFVFEDETLVCERIYFDQATMVRQLLGGIDKRSPRGVVTLVRALAGLARMNPGGLIIPRVVRWALPFLAALALATGALLAYAEHTLFRPEAFADRVETSLRAPPVRAAAAGHLTTAVLAVRPDLTAVRPLVELVAKGLVGTDGFRWLVRRAALEAHRAAFDDHRRAVALDVRDTGLLIADGIRSVQPKLAVNIPETVTTRIASVTGGIDGFLLRLSEVAETGEWLGPWAFAFALLLAGASLVFTESRRASVLRLGLAVAVVGAAVALGSALLPWMIAGGDGGRAVRAALAVWLDPVTAWSLAACVAGTVVMVAAASIVRPVPVGRWLRRGRAVVLTPPEHPLLRGARLLVAIGLGVAMLVSPTAVLQALVVALGALLVLVATAEALAAVAGPPLPTRGPRSARRGLRVGAASLAITAAIAVAVLVTGGDAGSSPFRERCNGHAVLCDRRVDQVAFLTTHNAMAAAGEPGWLFAAQDAGIPAQLEEGVRGLMIDTHYGTATGRGVLTELDRSAGAGAKIGEKLSGRFVDTAEQVRRRLLRSRVTGKRQVFLCHTFCEVGATRALTALRAVHEFVATHPGEVVMLLIQDETSATDTAAAIRAAGLVDEVYRGDARRPWPTLRELVERDQRVIVLAENHSGQEPWIHDQSTTAQETPYTFPTVAALAAPAGCEPNRGGTAGSLFLVNHWVDTSPAPRVTIARQVNADGFLTRRLTMCRKMRGMLPNLVAVDFYRQGDAARVVDRLNGVG